MSGKTPGAASAYALIGAVSLTYILMVMGTFVTSTGSGLACPDWPLCYGSVRPPLRVDIWFEWGHRLLGALAGIVILISTVLVWRSYKGTPRYLTGAVLALMAAAVALGGVVVITEAPLLDSFLHVLIVSSHLVISMLVLVCLVMTLGYVLKAGVPGSKGCYYTQLFILVLLQVVVGIFVRYSGATLACVGFPLCNGHIIPPFTHYGVALHYAHRVLAVIAIAAAAALLVRAIRTGTDVLSAIIIFLTLLAQSVIGALIVIAGIFLPVVVLHAALGFLLPGYLAFKSASELFSETHTTPEPEQ